MPLTEEQADWMRRVLPAIGRRPDPPPQGMLAQPLGAQYVGEERSAAWRYDQGEHESDERFEERRQRGDLTTRHYTDAERAARRLETDAAGQVAHADGSSAEGTRLYAMDPATGAIVTARGAFRNLELGPDGQPTGRFLPPGAFMDDLVASVQSGGTRRLEAEHHSTMLAGGDVASAGSVTVQGGKVTAVSNASGHYRPRFEHLLQAVEALLRSGAMLDTEIVDAEGRSLKDANPRAFAAWQKVQGMRIALAREAPRIIDRMEAADDPMLSEAERAGIAAWLEDCHDRLRKVEEGAAILRKMGIGPRNRVAGTVEVVHAPAGADGGDVRSGAQSRHLPAAEFMAGTAAPGTAPLRGSGPREAVNAEFAEEARRRGLRPEDRAGTPPGTVAEHRPSPAEAAAAEAALAALAGGDGAPAAAAAPGGGGDAPGGGYDRVNPNDLAGMADPDADPDDKAPPAAGPGAEGGAQPAPDPGDGIAPVAGYGAVPEGDDGREEALPNLPGDAGYGRVAEKD